MPFFLQENKSKVLELILHDLKGNWCKMMALVYLHMLIGVATKNIETQSPELMLMLTQGA
jgi:hypothetical protein